MADFVGRAIELEKEGRLQEALTYYDMAVEEMDKIHEWIISQHSADYFFNSNTI